MLIESLAESLCIQLFMLSPASPTGAQPVKTSSRLPQILSTNLCLHRGALARLKSPAVVPALQRPTKRLLHIESRCFCGSLQVTGELLGGASAHRGPDAPDPAVGVHLPR